jgi:hypothetical protein
MTEKKAPGAELGDGICRAHLDGYNQIDVNHENAQTAPISAGLSMERKLTQSLSTNAKPTNTVKMKSLLSA